MQEENSNQIQEEPLLKEEASNHYFTINSDHPD